MRLQARLLKLPSRGQPGAVCSIGMPPPKPPPPVLTRASQGQPRNVGTTGMLPPKPLPPPRPVITTAALPPPVKAAHLAAAAHLGKLQQRKTAPNLGPTFPGWRRISMQRAGGGQQGSQNAAKQALLQPSATAHIQLLSSANTAVAKIFRSGKGSEQGAQGHAQRQVSNSGPLAQRGSQAGAGQPSRGHAASTVAAQSALTRPQAGAGQPSREHAASAAAAQPASTQPQPGTGQPSREHAASAAAAQSASTQPEGSGQSSAAAASSATLAPQRPGREFAQVLLPCH